MSYTHEDLREAVFRKVHGKPDTDGTYTVMDPLLRDGVREVVETMDLRSTKRSVGLALAGRNDIIYDETTGTYDVPTLVAVGQQALENEYHCPIDVKDYTVIDIRKRTDRSKPYSLVSEEEFDIRKNLEDSIFAIKDREQIRTLMINGVPAINTLDVHDCDTYNGDGTFTAVGDASAIATEVSDYVEGDGAVTFGSSNSQTTAGVVNSTFTAVDLSAYEDQKLFVWVKIPTTVDLTKLTSFTLRWGSDASNYLSKTVTRNNESLAFYYGWNLLKFDWASATQTGTPDLTAIDYVSFFMTKDASMAAVTGWIVDRILVAIDSGVDLVYYSKYGWQDENGAWKENSTVDSDVLNVDSTEFNLIVFKCAQVVSENLDNSEDADKYENRFNTKAELYLGRNPSEAKPITSSYYNVGSLADVPDDTTDDENE